LAVIPFPSFDHFAVSALDLGDRSTHSFSKGTAMESRSRLLADTARISMHLIESVSGVVNAKRLHPFLGIEQQNDRVIDDLVALRREVNAQPRPESMIEDPAILGSH
jgi:hypothetical protein